MLGVLLGDLRKLGLDRGDAVLFRPWQIRAGVPEIRQRFLDKALGDGRKRRDFWALADSFDESP
jgi:hypothetical protein